MLLPCSGEEPVQLELTVNTHAYHTTVDRYTGTPEHANALLRISPNPVGDMLILSGPGSEVQVQICDTRGRVVLEKNSWFTSDPLDVSRLASGIYLLRIRGNSSLRTERFVKQ